MMAMPTNTPGVVHLLAGSKDRALHRHITDNKDVIHRTAPADIADLSMKHALPRRAAGSKSAQQTPPEHTAAGTPQECARTLEWPVGCAPMHIHTVWDAD